MVTKTINIPVDPVGTLGGLTALILDKREEFKDVLWQQGRLLLTNETRRWSKEERDGVDEIERRTAFAFFTTSDQGISREYVFQYNSCGECKAAVEWHNYQLKGK